MSMDVTGVGGLKWQADVFEPFHCAVVCPSLNAMIHIVLPHIPTMKNCYIWAKRPAPATVPPPPPSPLLPPITSSKTALPLLALHHAIALQLV